MALHAVRMQHYIVLTEDICWMVDMHSLKATRSHVINVQCTKRSKTVVCTHNFFSIVYSEYSLRYAVETVEVILLEKCRRWCSCNRIVPDHQFILLRPIGKLMI